MFQQSLSQRCVADACSRSGAFAPAMIATSVLDLFLRPIHRLKDRLRSDQTKVRIAELQTDLIQWCWWVLSGNLFDLVRGRAEKCSPHDDDSTEKSNLVRALPIAFCSKKMCQHPYWKEISADRMRFRNARSKNNNWGRIPRTRKITAISRIDDG